MFLVLIPCHHTVLYEYPVFLSQSNEVPTNVPKLVNNYIYSTLEAVYFPY